MSELRSGIRHEQVFVSELSSGISYCSCLENLCADLLNVFSQYYYLR